MSDKDEQLLRTLGAYLRDHEEPSADAAVPNGRVPDGQVPDGAVLDGAAGADGGMSDERMAALEEALFAQLSGTAVPAAVVPQPDAAAAGGRPAPPAHPGPEQDGEAVPSTKATDSTVVRPAPGFFRRPAVAGAIGALALAAGALLAVLPRSGSDDAADPALPSYAAEAQGGRAVMRSAAPPAAAGSHLRLPPGGVLTVVLTPAQDVVGTVVARAVLQPGDMALVARTETAASGALRMRLQLPAELPAQGTLNVWVARDDAAARRAQDPHAQQFSWPYERVTR